MVALCILTAVLALVGAAVFSHQPARLQEPMPADDTPVPDEEAEMLRIIEDDPVEALLRYGTTEDAERLMEQGIDLEALGYRPPEER